VPARREGAIDDQFHQGVVDALAKWNRPFHRPDWLAKRTAWPIRLPDGTTSLSGLACKPAPKARGVTRRPGRPNRIPTFLGRRGHEHILQLRSCTG
jgi:hypothetical protein